jgi:hypothetical protein
MSMNKEIGIALFGIFLLPCIAMADEMIVSLKSGNSLVIHYTGAIHGITMEGASDAIVAINTAAEPEKISPAGTSRQQLEPAVEKESKEDNGDKENKLRVKWADPIQEDVPFPKR